MPESIVVLRRFLAVAGIFTLAVPATFAQSAPEAFGGVFWGGGLALGPGLEGPMPGRFACSARDESSALPRSLRHDAMRARARADAGARATAELALLHAESGYRISVPPRGDTLDQLELAPAAGARP